MGSAIYAGTGRDPVTVSVADVGGSVLTSSGKIGFKVADAAVAMQRRPPSIIPWKGTAPEAKVLATFTDGNPNALASNFAATVAWGGTMIGTPSVAVQFVSRTVATSTWCVKGSAVYATKGTYAVRVNVTDVGGSSLASSNKVQFKVSKAILADVTLATNYSVAVTKSTGSRVLATFTDSNPLVAANGFAAAVNWGGTVSGTPSVTIQLVSRTATSSTWNVVGSAVYAKRGNYRVSVEKITDVNGSTLATSVVSLGWT